MRTAGVLSHKMESMSTLGGKRERQKKRNELEKDLNARLKAGNSGLQRGLFSWASTKQQFKSPKIC